MGYSYVGYDEITKSVQIIKSNNYQPVYYNNKKYYKNIVNDILESKTNSTFEDLVNKQKNSQKEQKDPFEAGVKKLICQISEI